MEGKRKQPNGAGIPRLWNSVLYSLGTFPVPVSLNIAKICTLFIYKNIVVTPEAPLSSSSVTVSAVVLFS